MDANSTKYDANLLRLTFNGTSNRVLSGTFFVEQGDTIKIRGEGVSSYKLRYDAYSISYHIDNGKDNVTKDYKLIYEQGEVSTGTDILTYVVPKNGDYKIECKQVWSSGSANVFIAIQLNGIVQKDFTYTGSSPKVVSGELTECKKGDIIKVYKNGTSTYKCEYLKLYEKSVDSPVARILYPQKIETIGNKTQAVIYGKLGDEYITDFDCDLTYNVQTGNITLGNAIGFIQVKYRGITYKIPVYG